MTALKSQYYTYLGNACNVTNLPRFFKRRWDKGTYLFHVMCAPSRTLQWDSILLQGIQKPGS